MTAPARYHHGDLRAALIARATEVIATGGVDALSLRELARDIGVSHGAPGRHFPDKQALLDAVALNGFGRLRDVLLDALRRRGSDPFADQLVSLATAYVQFATGQPSLLAVMFAAKHRRQAPAELRSAVDETFAAPLQAVRDAQARGEVAAGPVDEFGTAILSTMHGYAALVAGGLLTPDDTAELTTTIRLLVDGLRPR
jgi:AcrR family transcriptional regulator